MTTQYIGARYVPKFEGVHDNSRAYEPLCIVTDSGNTTSYTSKKDVPVGVALNNTDYWAVTGTVSGSILDLQGRTSALETDIVKKEVKVKNRKYLFVGDSYGDETGEWADIVSERLTDLGAECEVLCVGGASFGSSDAQYKFLTQIQNYTGDKNEITDIVVCGGLNDSVSESLSDPYYSGALISGMTSFNDYVVANYPNAEVSLGYIGNGVDFESTSLIGYRVYSARCTCLYYYMRYASNFGWKWLSNLEYALSGAYANMGSDGVHPSTIGSTELAMSILYAITGGDGVCYYPLYQMITSNLLDNSLANMRFRQHNADCFLDIPANTYIVCTSAVTENLTLGNTHQYFNRHLYVPVDIRLDGFNGKTYQYIKGLLLFVKNEVSLALMQTVDGETVTTFTPNGESGVIRIMPTTASYPAMSCS